MMSPSVSKESAMNVYDQEWILAEKKIDPNFIGSLFETLGFEATLCPTCGSHLHHGICLNACHLAKESREKFATLMSGMKSR